MRVVNMVPDMQYQMQQSENSLSTALQQVSTGLRVNQLSDDPSASAAMVVSLTRSASVDQYTKNISALQSQMQTADSVISSVVTQLSSAITLGTEGANSTSNADNRAAIATQIQAVLSSVVAQANMSYQGAYLFGGSVTNTQPFVRASTSYTSGSTSLSMSTPLTPGSVTTISDATTGQSLVFKASAGDTVAGLANAVSSAISSGRLSQGTSVAINGSGRLQVDSAGASTGIVVSSNDSALGGMSASGTLVPNAYAYVGNSSVNNVQIGEALSVHTNISGSTLFGNGTNVLSSLASLVSALQSGNTDQIGAATSAISTALNNLSQQRIPFDNSINQLNAQDTFLGQETVTLSMQQKSLVGIDLATAATNLSQAEQQNSAVLAAAAKVLPQTLLQYLQP